MQYRHHFVLKKKKKNFNFNSLCVEINANPNLSNFTVFTVYKQDCLHHRCCCLSVQLGVHIFLGLVVGAIFFGVKDDQSGIQNRSKFLKVFPSPPCFYNCCSQKVVYGCMSLSQSFPILYPFLWPSAGGPLHMRQVLLKGFAVKSSFPCHCCLFGWKFFLLPLPFVGVRMLLHRFNITFSPMLFQGSTCRSGSIMFNLQIKSSQVKSTLLSSTLYMPNIQHRWNFSPLVPTVQQSNK